MRSLPIILIFGVLLFSCSEAGSVEYTGEGEEEEFEEADSSLLDTVDGAFLEAHAFLDGPDEWFYMVSADEDFEYGSEIDFTGVEELHIIPHPEYTSSSGLQDMMIGIAQVGFGLNSPFNEFWGMVKVYYDVEKTVLACEYEVAGGKPIGTCTLLDPDGNVFLERDYNFDSRYEGSSKEPFCAMWRLDQENSNLIIDDKENGFKAEGANEVVNIMPSNYTDPSGKSNLYQVMSKETFKNQFQINGEVFTGILRAYFHPNSLEEDMYYELPFRNGWLHGDVMIYDEWGGLYLHEIFDNGELDSTVFQMQYEDGVAKPIIYLYPEEDTYVNVEIEFEGVLTHTYPKYGNGWKVLAKEDGTLYDEKGKEYYALYWEGDNRQEFDVTEGFVVPGDKTAGFLEEALEIQGLNRREANEFIVYWLPKMENNPYNLIHFSTNQYEEMAKLNISPKPETLIRVMMVYQPLQTPIDIPMQDLSKLKKERKGFTVVEWGGTQLKRPLIQ